VGFFVKLRGRAAEAQSGTSSSETMIISRSLMRVAVGVTVFFLALMGGILLHWRFTYYRVWLSSTSPDNKYQVELTGDKGRGGFLIYSAVKYNVLINEHPIVRDRLLHYGDAMDISFEIAYPEHAWIDGSTLRFWSNRHRREDNLDTLLISNSTDKTIRFLRINAWDLFFVFDVKPHSQLSLKFTHRSEGKGISVEGEFEDGSIIDYGVGFLENGSTGPMGYCMTIDYDRVKVNSPRERAYDNRGNWNNLNIDAAPDCAPQQ
jgi:hypothetical protein